MDFTPDVALHLMAQALFVSVLIAGPILLLSMVVGLVVSVFQVATQIQEMSLTFIPKLIAVVATLLFFGPWMLRKLITYATALYESIPAYV